jgi:deoxyribodipyrimidine photolyase-related protein
MVTGFFALSWGVRPREVCKWSLAVYVVEVERAQRPDPFGMSQHADA